MPRTQFALAMDAIKAYHTGASEDVLLKQPEFGDLRKRFLRTALDFYGALQKTLERSPGVGEEGRASLAEACFQVAAISSFSRLEISV